MEKKEAVIMVKKISNRFFSLSLAVVVLIGALSFVSCNNKLVYEDGKFYCARTKVTYVEADFQYYPVSISAEKYGTLKENGEKTDLFSIENVAPEKWLATADGRLFCAEGEFVPTLAEFSADKILVCKEGTSLTMSVAELSSPQDVLAVLESLSNGVPVEYPTTGEAAEFLSIRFSSQLYPWLYYSTSYVEFEEDVCITDYVSDLSSYVERKTDDTVKKTVSTAFDCWYKVENGVDEKVIAISNATGILSATVTKMDSDGVKNEYIGLLFSDESSVEECIETVIGLYDGELSEEEIRSILLDPDMIEQNTVIEYNYGKHLIYDRATGKCVKAPQELTGIEY